MPPDTSFNLIDIIDTERKMLIWAGFYPQRNKSILYYFSAALGILAAHLLMLSMTVAMVIDRNDLSKLTDILLVSITWGSFLCKLNSFLYYKKHLLEIEEKLADPTLNKFSSKQLKLFKEKIRSANILAKTYRSSCILVCIFYSIWPALGGEKGVLPLRGWFPYNTEKIYYETEVFQVLTLWSSAICNSNIDILTWKLISIAGGELVALKEDLQNLERSQDVRKKFVSCVERHNAIINLVQKIEFVFSTGILMQFLSSVVVICFTGFQLIPINSSKFIVMVLYIFCMFCQVAMYCWFGHDSDELGWSCYLSKWYEFDMEVKKNIAIFLEKTKNPTILTAGNFVTLSLQTLTTVLRSSYSYFAVLQRVYQDS